MSAADWLETAEFAGRIVYGLGERDFRVKDFADCRAETFEKFYVDAAVIHKIRFLICQRAQSVGRHCLERIDLRHDCPAVADFSGVCVAVEHQLQYCLAPVVGRRVKQFVHAVEICLVRAGLVVDYAQCAESLAVAPAGTQNPLVS